RRHAQPRHDTVKQQAKHHSGLPETDLLQHPLDRPSVTKSLADALDMPLGDLLAEPTLTGWTADSGNRTVPTLRAALTYHGQLTLLLGMPAEGEPTPIDELKDSMAEVWDAYQDSRYGFATRRLP
ncbi:hypothetical protein ACFXJL_29340, partial [Streptomyces sp. NPDC059256]